MLPFLEVEHLPSSSSFYAAVIQPLGLRYLSTEDGHFPSITYGTPSRPVFQIRQVVPSRDRPLRASHIVLSTSSPAAADDAYEFALRAVPDARDAYAAAGGPSVHRTRASSGGPRVFITDFDGNMMEIVYQPPPEYPPHHRGPTIRYTKSTTDEVSRILDWNYDVASSSPPASAGPSSTPGAGRPTASRRSHARYAEDTEQPPPGLRRSVTAGSSVYEPATSARENSKGLSAGAVVGTLLGVAAGAALGGAFTYNMTKSDRSGSSRQPDYDMPSFTRRSTFPEGYDGYSDRKPRYADAERVVEKVRYESDYPPAAEYRRPPPEYMARYSQVDTPPSKDTDGVYDSPRGRRPSSRSRTSSARPRSESASYREPYGGGDVEYRSYTSSRGSRHPPVVQRTYTYDTPDRESYVSARSRRSNSTVRAPAAPDHYGVPTHTVSRSRSGSRVSTTTYKVSPSPRAYSREGSYVSARHVPLPDSRAPSYISARDVPLPESRAPSYLSARDVPLPDSRAHSYISARDVPLPGSRAHTYIPERDVPLAASRPATYLSAQYVPLPESRVGSGYARWDADPGDGDDDDDADSIAPSDSISCVGSRRSGRSYR